MVAAIITNVQYILSRKEVGDLSGMAYLDEFEQAAQRADLTEYQAEAVELRMRGYDYESIAEIQGRQLAAVHKSFMSARTKIAAQYDLGASKPGVLR